MSDPRPLRKIPSGNGYKPVTNGYDQILNEAEFEISNKLSAAEKIKIDPESFLEEQKRYLDEALEKAKNFYRKKEYGKAFSEWDKVCFSLGENDEFKKRVRHLKSSHENLIRANEELAQVRQAMAERLSPAAKESKFVQDASDGVNAQVKNIYSAMSSEIRAQRIPKSVSFWWPVLLALAILVSGLAGLTAYFKLQSQKLGQSGKAQSLMVPQQAMDESYLEASRRTFEKQIEALNLEHQETIEALSRKHAESAKDDREKIIQFETRLREAESKNTDLERQLQAVMQGSDVQSRAYQSLE